MHTLINVTGCDDSVCEPLSVILKPVGKAAITVYFGAIKIDTGHRVLVCIQYP